MSLALKTPPSIVRDLVNGWQERTAWIPDHGEKVKHTLYKEVLQLAQQDGNEGVVVRILFEELEKEVKDSNREPIVYLLLVRIFGPRSPRVPDEYHNDLRVRANVWLAFARQAGYLPAQGTATKSPFHG